MIRLFLVLLFICVPGQALAHGWYSGKKDPVYKDSCCGGTDCESWIIQPGEIDAVKEGYRVRLSLERARTINPYTIHPIDALVIWERVQPSEDGNWHLCIMTSSRTADRGGIYCLFAPPDT